MTAVLIVQEEILDVMADVKSICGKGKNTRQREAIQRVKKMDGDAYLYTRETKCKLRRKSRVKGK